MKFTKSEEETRELYLNHHKNYANNPDIFLKHYKYSSSCENYLLPEGWFKGKKVVDIGCGNNGVLQKAFYDMGCSSISCLDIGDKWINFLKEVLNSHKLNLNVFSFHAGNAIELPFETDTFDFAACFGVLMVLESFEHIELAIKEMMRVVVPGGICNADFGYGNTGVLNSFINPALREAYSEDNEFADYIDNLDLEEVKKEFFSILSTGINKDKLITEDLINKLLELITLDTINYFQDELRVPIKLDNKLNEKYVIDLLKKYGAKNIKRCPEFYYERKDFRRFLTPFHVTRNKSKYSKLMFGPGNLKFTWTK